MKTKLYLISVGTLIGIAFGLTFGYGVKLLLPSRTNAAGASFESVDDLRASILKRDDRDKKGNEQVSLRSLIGPHPSNVIIYDLLPHLNVQFQNANVTTNSCGMRGPERQIEKSNDVYRIALLGDSFTFGWGVEYEQSFAHLLEKKLNIFAGGSPRVEVLNFGIPGYSTFQELALFEDRVAEFNPDAVLVYFVENDYGLPFFIHNYNDDNSGNLVGADKFQGMNETEEAKEKSGKLLGKIDPNRALQQLAKLTEDRGIALYVTINPTRHYDQDWKSLWALRRVPHLQFLPLRKSFLQVIKENSIDKNELVLKNDPHPSPIMHEILANLLAPPFLDEILENPTTRRQAN